MASYSEGGKDPSWKEQGKGLSNRKEQLVHCAEWGEGGELGNFFKLINLFLAALGLGCCARASHCSGFSCCGAQALGARAQ